MNRLREFLRRHLRALIALHDTPHSIAGAVAIGIFLGFTPLFCLKTLLAILIAWAFRCNTVAAAVAVTLHDVTIPIAPVILRIEYQIGYFLLSHPHTLPPKVHPLHFGHSLHWPTFTRFGWPRLGWPSLHGIWHYVCYAWSTFPKLGWPTLLGSIFVGGPLAVISYFVVLRTVSRYQMRRRGRRHKPVSQ
jgi:uncharacterized protein (DUF2062 family)